jgi:hypothetical protein
MGKIRAQYGQNKDTIWAKYGHNMDKIRAQYGKIWGQYG